MNDELAKYAEEARRRAFEKHPERVARPPACGRCDDTGWEPCGRDRLAPVKRCRNGCDIPQAEHLKRREKTEPARDEF